MPRRTVLLLTSPDLGWFGLNATLRSMDDVRVLGEAAYPDRARALAAEQPPDAICCPTWLGDGPSPRILQDLQRGPCPTSRIAFVSRGICPSDIAATAGLRYHAWLLWPEVSSQEMPYLLGAILFTNSRLATSTPADLLLGGAARVTSGGAWTGNGHGPTILLAPQERAALALLARENEAELTVTEVARHLNVKPSTVETYIDRIAGKLDLPHGGRRKVVAGARHRGLVG